jgi:hypothetical protein
VAIGELLSIVSTTLPFVTTPLIVGSDEVELGDVGLPPQASNTAPRAARETT